MSQKEKLIAKLRSNSSITFDEAELLLGYMSYYKSNKGRTSGSRVAFVCSGRPPIFLHKPHPNNELKPYQVRQLVDFLKKEGLLK